jgi:endonuclease I
MFMRWHQNDPATDEEIRIHKAKAQVQGNVNPYYLD